MMRLNANVPEQPKVPPMPTMAAEFDRLYLEKCQEVNELEQKVEKYKSMAEIAVKREHELEKQLEEIKQEAFVSDLISRKRALIALDVADSMIIPIPEKLNKATTEQILNLFNRRTDTARELINEIPAASSASTIRELAAEPLKGFTPDVEPPEELPEELMEELPLWALQPVSTQDILCLSSALKNLYDIHKCDGWLLYNKLAKVLEQKIKEYCGED